MNNHDNIKKIVLAYSGGLDTSIIIPWLKENYNNPEIIAVAGNVGQADELEGLEAKAIATGASKLIVADLVDEMVDEVIIPAYTFCASAIPFGDLGAKIVWADINPDTWTIDPDDIARKITPKTKAVVCVHLLGMPCDMKKIVPIARAHGLKVVEDCAQALDCRIDGQHVGTFGDFGCFSFHSAKTMTTLGEGGMFVCADDADAAAAPGIRHNG